MQGEKEALVSIDEFDYREDLKIDKYNLDEECRDQAMRYSKWATLCVDAVEYRDRIKQQLLTSRAVTEAGIRKVINSGKGSDIGIIKGTEGEIKAAVDLDSEVQNMEELLIQANRQVGMFMVAKEAFHDRKKELENLVQLWLSAYWADPRLPSKENLKEERFEQQHSEKITETIKRRKGVK